jgi:hypothetical protein
MTAVSTKCLLVYIKMAESTKVICRNNKQISENFLLQRRV